MLYLFHLILLLPLAVLATLNEPCLGSGGRPGVCLRASTCRAGGGAGVQASCQSGEVCCTQASCKNSVFSGGNCRWTSDCAGASPGFGCVGPGNFVCCRDPNGHYGGYKTPSLPSVGACKQVSVNGAAAGVKAFPGRIRQVGCYRDGSCYSGNEHPCGLAVDLMCSDQDGSPTNGGVEIAEWYMNNAKRLNVLYVIWGQRIWNTQVEGTPRPWIKWRVMPNRGSITENHWDHVHVSFK